MGSNDRQVFARKVRPILWRKDYDAAKTALIEVATTSPDDARFLGLLRAVYDYERSGPSFELLRIVELAECVFVPAIPGADQRSRRWSDDAARVAVTLAGVA
jgi:hypothetical protein